MTHGQRVLQLEDGGVRGEGDWTRVGFFMFVPCRRLIVRPGGRVTIVNDPSRRRVRLRGNTVDSGAHHRGPARFEFSTTNTLPTEFGTYFVHVCTTTFRVAKRPGLSPVFDFVSRKMFSGRLYVPVLETN